MCGGVNITALRQQHERICAALTSYKAHFFFPYELGSDLRRGLPYTFIYLEILPHNLMPDTAREMMTNESHFHHFLLEIHYYARECGARAVEMQYLFL